MHFRFDVHINWPGSQSKEFVSSGHVVVEAVVVTAAASAGVVVVDEKCSDNLIVAIDVAATAMYDGDFDWAISDEPVNDWPFFTQNISQIPFSAVFQHKHGTTSNFIEEKLCVRNDSVRLVGKVNFTSICNLPHSASSLWSWQLGYWSHFCR